MTARDTALTALIALRRQKAWSDGILKEYMLRDKLDKRDAALASLLCYGVMQNRDLLDFYISAFLKGSINRLDPIVLDILRLGVFQLTKTDKIPPSAAVNEAVEQTKRYANKQASGLVNGVLRAIERNKNSLPVPESLSVRYSHPQKLVELLRENVGEEKLEALLQANNSAPRTCAQVNPLKTSEHALREELQALSIDADGHPYLPNCLYLSGTGNVERLDAFRQGKFYMQDPAAKLAAICGGATPGICVLDACAAPGGKSFASAILMENQGEIISCDIHEHKIKLLSNGAERLGLSIIRPMLQDASKLREEWKNHFDLVIADVPCSGLGVIRKKPDIRYKDPADFAALPLLQSKILATQANYVKPGGVLLYSTCTVVKAENEEVVEQFLREHPEFTLEPMTLPQELNLPNEGMATFLPCDHDTDGFFVCRMRKSA